MVVAGSGHPGGAWSGSAAARPPAGAAVLRASTRLCGPKWLSTGALNVRAFQTPVLCHVASDTRLIHDPL